MACTYNHEKKNRSIYLDGVQVAHDTEVSPFADETGGLMFGAIMMNNNVSEYYKGILDDIRVYDKVLTVKEIQKVASSTTDAQYQSLSDAIKEAKKLIKEQNFQQVISLTEKELSKYEQFKKKNSEKNIFSYDVMASKLNYLHGMALEATGGSKNIIAEDYKKVVLLDISSEENMQGNTLQWFFQNKNTEYNDIVNSFFDNNRNYLKSVADKSKSMISNRQAEAAIKFLESNIELHTKWQEKHPYDEVVVEDMFPVVYYQLAKAKAAAKAPIKDVAKTYISVFNQSELSFNDERTDSLIWLVENNCSDECSEAIKKASLWSNDANGKIRNIVVKINDYYEANGDWEHFKTFLDVLFSTMENPAEWALRVKSYFDEEDAVFTKSYAACLEQNSGLNLKIEIRNKLDTIQSLKSEEKFSDAAKLYQEIIEICGKEEKKGYEFDLCECLFQGEKFNEVNDKLNQFLNKYKTSSRDILEKAFLMQGRTLMQLTEFDQARDVFFKLIIEYPEIEEAPEVSFIIGNCYMLQGKFDEAKEAFSIVLRDYADSDYKEQAQDSLDRINLMN